MAAGTLSEMIRRFRAAGPAAGAGGVTDAQLLGRFASRGEQDAFELLLWRHAGTVLGVCRRLLRDERDAEDCFQATFLVLARKAGSIGRGESVGAWLHKVARRAALRARVGAAARAAREGPLYDEAEPLAPGAGQCDEAAWAELREALDEQVERLPSVYREAFVLRCLAGKSAAEAARELGCSPATVESRLARARQRLRERLAGRGFGPEALRCAVPASVVSEVLSAALAAGAAGRAAVGGSVSPRAAALAGEVVRAMTMTRLKGFGLMVMALLASAVAAGGAGVLASGDSGGTGPGRGAAAVARKPPRDGETNPKGRERAAEERGKEEAERQDEKELRMAEFYRRTGNPRAEGFYRDLAARRQADAAVTKARADDKTSAAEMKKLQGAWNVIWHEDKGEAVPADRFEESDHCLVIEAGGAWVEKNRNEVVGEKCRIELSDPGDGPKRLDLSHGGKQKDARRINRCIYEVVGDGLLVVCQSYPGEDRPTAFATGPKAKRTLTIYKKRQAK